MRLALWLFFACCLCTLPGCQSTPAPDSTTTQSTATPPPSNPVVTPIHPITGEVKLVNLKARYIIVDFFLSPMPEPGQKLSVYRDGQKVGEVKVSPQSRSSLVAADILAGEAQPGDEIKIE